jgi:hypothetical protein
MVCPPVTSEARARRPRSISNFGGLCQTRKTPTLVLPNLAKKRLAGMYWKDYQSCLTMNRKNIHLKGVEKKSMFPPREVLGDAG